MTSIYKMYGDRNHFKTCEVIADVNLQNLRINFLMRKILRLEAWLVVIAEDDAVLHGAVCIGLGNHICREQVEGR